MTEPHAHPKNCAECVYWQQLREREGLCRRYPPYVSGRSDEVAHWPQTHSRQVCGEGRVAQGRVGATCAVCIYWRSSPTGLNPMDRGDMQKAWWARAGICVRCAPRPNSEPGARAFWPATADVDGCGEGVVFESDGAV
jgi:hypothetical protein